MVMIFQGKFVVIICTYKRTNLLRLLIEDVLKQNCKPDRIIIVDGDPASDEVMREISTIINTKFIYIPSNHANIAYQRYLGFRCAQSLAGIRVALYMDDDIRIPDLDGFEKILLPFGRTDIVGVTAFTRDDQNSGKFEKKFPFIDEWIDRYRPSQRLLPGSVTPTGTKVPPSQQVMKGYLKVGGMQGRIMAFELSALNEACFPDGMFALFEKKLGMGEDLYISLIAAENGMMLLSSESNFIHQDFGRPQAYPTEPFRFGYTLSFSRRIINDYFVWRRVKFARFYLIRSYIAGVVINFVRLLLNFSKPAFLFWHGYLTGAIRGLLQKPTAQNLTPHIHWRADAEQAMADQIHIK